VSYDKYRKWPLLCQYCRTKAPEIGWYIKAIGIMDPDTLPGLDGEVPMKWDIVCLPTMSIIVIRNQILHSRRLWCHNPEVSVTWSMHFACIIKQIAIYSGLPSPITHELGSPLGDASTNNRRLVGKLKRFTLIINDTFFVQVKLNILNCVTVSVNYKAAIEGLSEICASYTYVWWFGRG